MAQKNFDALEGTGLLPFEDFDSFPVKPAKKPYSKKSILKEVQKQTSSVPLTSNKATRKRVNIHYADKIVEDYTQTDWIEYFKDKALEHRVHYQPVSNFRKAELEAVTYLTQTYSPCDLKLIIDFMWDVWENERFDKTTLRFTVLLTTWSQEIVTLAYKWKNGEKVVKKEKYSASKRGWKVTEEDRKGPSVFI